MQVKLKSYIKILIILKIIGVELVTKTIFVSTAKELLKIN